MKSLITVVPLMLGTLTGVAYQAYNGLPIIGGVGIFVGITMTFAVLLVTGSIKR